MFARIQIQRQILGRGRAVFGKHGLCVLAAALTTAACLSGCGQKGPLYFPPPPKAALESPAPGAAAKPVPAAAITSDIPAPPPASPPTFTPR